MKLSNRLYDILKLVCTIILPALGTLYFTLSQIWGLPYGNEIGGTLDCISLFIGTCINISSAKFNKEKSAEPPFDEEQ